MLCHCGAPLRTLTYSTVLDPPFIQEVTLHHILHPHHPSTAHVHIPSAHQHPTNTPVPTRLTVLASSSSFPLLLPPSAVRTALTHVLPAPPSLRPRRHAATARVAASTSSAPASRRAPSTSVHAVSWNARGVLLLLLLL